METKLSQNWLWLAVSIVMRSGDVPKFSNAAMCNTVVKFPLLPFFTITAEILARSVANFYRQYADRHMNLKFDHLLS